MSKGKRLIVTLMSSGMATAMSFVVSLFLTPFITNMLGTEAYGFVTLSKNFVSYAVIISTALDSYATRYIAMEYHKRDFDKANSYVSSAFYGRYNYCLGNFCDRRNFCFVHRAVFEYISGINCFC